MYYIYKVLWMHNFFIYVITFNHVMQKRFQNDMAINNNTVDLLQDQKWESVPWKRLQVGDIVRVSAILFYGFYQRFFFPI